MHKLVTSCQEDTAGKIVYKGFYKFNALFHNVKRRFMTKFLHWAVVIVFIAMALSACGKSEYKNGASPPSTVTPVAQVQTKTYGKEDGECYAGIIKEMNAKHLAQTDFHKWKDQLNGKDKDWINGFLGFYSNTVAVVKTHIGRTPKQLYESNLITLNQLNVIEGYLHVYQEDDLLRASALSASACINVGFTKGTDLN
jgi:hypothetical protein